MADLPLTLAIAPFPEGFVGDMDETFQQAYQNTTATVVGNILTGLILPPGSTLPTTNQGPVAMGNTWYFWDTGSQTYVPQSGLTKPAKNFFRNSSYQVAQLFTGGTLPTIGVGVTNMMDMTLVRQTVANVLTASNATAVPAGPDNDLIPAGITYTVSATTVATPAATDIFTHEHLIEGSDIKMLQGEVTSLSFSILVNQAGTYSAYLTNSGRDASYVANFTIAAAQANTWTRVKISGIPPFPAFGTWAAFAEGTTGLYVGVAMALGSQWKTATPNQWASGIFCGTSSNINMVSVANNQMSLTGFKFEPATAPTYYQTPSFGEEYDGVIRYYFTTFNYQQVTGGVAITAVAHVANSVVFYYLFPRRMCKTPTVTPWNPVATPVSGNIYNLSTAASTAQATLTAVPKGIAMTVNPTAAKGDVFAAYIQANARLT